MLTNLNKIKFSNIILILFIIIKLTIQRITISNPFDLVKIFDNKKIKSNFANFGKLSYGYNFIGKLHYDLNDKDADYACKPLTKHQIEFENTVDRYPIVMVDRGNCTFVTKARNIQNIGGLFAIIIDNTDENTHNLIIADDGTGSDIYIPTVLISKKDGEKIKKYLLENKNDLNILTNIILSPQTNVVEYQFFFSSASLPIYKLIKDFRKYQNLISNSTDFRPHYVTHQSPEYSPNNTRSIPNCITKGLYCAYPRYDLGISDGRDIISENIRQKCIYSISTGKYSHSLYKQDINPSLYWNYMESFYDKCLNNTNVNFSQECANKSIVENGINNLLVIDCMINSYASGKDNVVVDLNNNNTILEEDYLIRKKWKVRVFPTIMVNNKTIKGSWNSDNLFEAICAGYIEKPEICYEKGYFSKSTNGKNNISLSTVFLILIIVVILNTLVYYICKRYIIKRINERVDNIDINGRINNVVTNYLALKDTN